MVRPELKACVSMIWCSKAKVAELGDDGFQQCFIEESNFNTGYTTISLLTLYVGISIEVCTYLKSRCTLQWISQHVMMIEQYFNF